MKSSTVGKLPFNQSLGGTVLHAPTFILSILPYTTGYSLVPPKAQAQKSANWHEGRWQVGGNADSRTQTAPAFAPPPLLGWPVHSGLSRTSHKNSNDLFGQPNTSPHSETTRCVNNPKSNSIPQRKSERDTLQWILIVWGVHSCEIHLLAKHLFTSPVSCLMPAFPAQVEQGNLSEFLFFLSFKIKSDKKLVFQTGVTRSTQL